MDGLEDINIEGVYDSGRSIKQSDKLNYKHVIQYHILECQKALGKTYYDDKVNALTDSIYFDIPGLNFRTRINEFIGKIDFERRVLIRCKERLNKNEMEHPIRRLLVEYDVDEKYLRRLNRFLVQIIAEYQGLIGMKGMVEEGMDEHTEEKKYKKIDQYKKHIKEEDVN